MTDLAIVHLRCEYRENPLGLDVRRPRLSWQLVSRRRGARQIAYRVIATAEANQPGGAHVLWDSGPVASDQSVQVAYAGQALGSGQRVDWRVKAWDATGASAESEAAWWEMGLLERVDWRAQWIGAPFFGGPRTSSPAPYLRREFSLSRPIASARLYATALGLYECRLNGARVGDDVLTPGWTDYTKRVQYQVYDVTSQLRSGANAFGVVLGDGWAVGQVAWIGRQRYVDRPRLLAQIMITYADGDHEVIATDGSWKVASGPILESDLLMGESYDARRELPGWDAPGFNDTGWQPVQLFPACSATLVATNGPTVRRQEELRPVAASKRSETTRTFWQFDFGQNMVGLVRLRVSGPAGTTIALKFAETLDAKGRLYTANLRTARNTDFYTLQGGAEEIWEPRFTLHGFRYVELSGYDGIANLETLTGIVIHSAMPTTGFFECSDPLLNQLQHNIVWSQKGNFVEVPTDCPQRDERLGWTADAQVFARTAAFNQDVAGFFSKWTSDLEDAQLASGAYPAVAPNPGAWPTDDGGPAWADAGIIVPWTIYLCYADTQLLADRYPSMQRFVDFLVATSRSGLRCFPEYSGWHGFGDWLALDGSDGREGATSKELIGTAYFAHSARLLARIAGVLGRAAEVVRYNALADEVQEAFRRAYVQPDGILAGGTQTAYVLALCFDLLPESAREASLAALVRDIEQRDHHLSTGFVGTPYLNWALSEHGRADLAYKLLRQTTWPSWLYPVTQGATTIWERWDGWTHERGFQDASMNSFNHFAYGAIGAWLYAVVGGIDLDPDHPGYKHVVMRPQLGGNLTNVTAELHSIYGLIRSAWTSAPNGFDWRITIPANSRATIHVPAACGVTIREGSTLAEQSPGVTLLRREAQVAIYSLGAGDYHFIAGRGAEADA